MATREISLVLNLVQKGAVAVEKESHLLWSLDDLLEAQSDQRFQNDDCVTTPSGHSTITSLFPGCPNMMGKRGDNTQSEVTAQTSHFLLFGSPEPCEKVSMVYGGGSADTDIT